MRLPVAITEMMVAFELYLGSLWLVLAIGFVFQVEKHRAVASRAPMPRGRGGRARGNKHRNKQPKDKMAQLAAYFV